MLAPGNTECYDRAAAALGIVRFVCGATVLFINCVAHFVPLQ
jgi:hypothetical protein